MGKTSLMCIPIQNSKKGAKLRKPRSGSIGKAGIQLGCEPKVFARRQQSMPGALDFVLMDAPLLDARYSRRVNSTFNRSVNSSISRPIGASSLASTFKMSSDGVSNNWSKSSSILQMLFC
jgi:hypothetical protein